MQVYTALDTSLPRIASKTKTRCYVARKQFRFKKIVGDFSPPILNVFVSGHFCNTVYKDRVYCCSISRWADKRHSVWANL